MEQIQQHEWVGRSQELCICIHCECRRLEIKGRYPEDTEFQYKKKWDTYRLEEPACITRPINAPAADKADQ